MKFLRVSKILLHHVLETSIVLGDAHAQSYVVHADLFLYTECNLQFVFSNRMPRAEWFP